MRQSDLYIKRIPGVPRRLQVGEKLNEIYDEYGYEDLMTTTDYDSNRRYVIETESIERASRKLEANDRRSIAHMTDSLSRYCGNNFGTKSAHQVLAKIGILLSAAESF